MCSRGPRVACCCLSIPLHRPCVLINTTPSAAHVAQAALASRGTTPSPTHLARALASKQRQQLHHVSLHLALQLAQLPRHLLGVAAVGAQRAQHVPLQAQVALLLLLLRAGTCVRRAVMGASRPKLCAQPANSQQEAHQSVMTHVSHPRRPLCAQLPLQPRHLSRRLSLLRIQCRAVHPQLLLQR